MCQPDGDLPDGLGVRGLPVAPAPGGGGRVVGRQVGRPTTGDSRQVNDTSLP